MRIEIKIIAASVGAGFIVWFFDALIGSFAFYEGSFFELLVTDIPAQTLHIRMIVIGMFTAFGIIVARILAKRNLTEKEREILLENMGERIKELNCLYQLAESIRSRELLEDTLYDTASLLPSAWHYPGITRGKLHLDEKEYVSDPFEPTPWKQSSDIVVEGIKRGSVEIYYLEEMPILDEGPFLKEERYLINSIALTISESIARRQAKENLKKQSITDELTGIFNRYHFFATLELEINRIHRYGGTLSTLIMDLNGFKAYNDNYGHINGDRVLQEFARTLKSVLRKSDMAFRYGGDEFVVLLPSTTAIEVRNTINRLVLQWQQTVAREFIVAQVPLTFCTGIAQCPNDGETPDSLMFLADSALFLAKKTGGFAIAQVSEINTLSTDDSGIARTDQVYALASTVEAKDPYTYGHSRRVSLLAEALGKSCGLCQEDILHLQSASLLHDIGKLGIPDKVLSKPGKLTDSEWVLVRKHCIEGARIVGHVRDLKALVPLILHHHEWFDGSGYPDGIKGEMIPVGARILCIADAYDTMTTDRPYRNRLSHDQAVDELWRNAGIQFDQNLVEVFCEVVDDVVRQKIFDISGQKIHY